VLHGAHGLAMKKGQREGGEGPANFLAEHQIEEFLKTA
jgi:hypothetical protein